jgi:hypothetical protein
VKASIAKARDRADALTKKLVTWPSWFFARGDLAAGGAGDESPLVFDDSTLTVEPTHSYTTAEPRSSGRRPASRAPTGRSSARAVDGHLTFDTLHKGAGEPVVIYRNPRVVLRTPASLPAPFEPVAITRRACPGRSSRRSRCSDILPRPRSRACSFGVSVDGTPSARTTSPPPGRSSSRSTSTTRSYLAELHTDVELGAIATRSSA